MNIPIHTAVYGTWGWVPLDGRLTNEHARSSYGQAVLVIEPFGPDDTYPHLVGVYGPGDRMPAIDRFTDGGAVNLISLHLDAEPTEAERAWLQGVFSDYPHGYRPGSETTGWVFGEDAWRRWRRRASGMTGGIT